MNELSAYLEKMKDIQENVLNFIEDESNSGILYSTAKYSEYFSQEIGLIEKDDVIKSIENFEKKRIIGKNRVIFVN